MKILFTGYHNPHFVTITEYIEKAIQRKGHTLFTFDDRNFLLPGRLRKAFPILQSFDIRRLNSTLLESVKKNNPDLVIVSGGHRILPETIQKLRAWEKKTALWTIDAPIDFDPVLAVAPFYDFIFCGGTEAMEILENRLSLYSHWLPFACDPKTHQSTPATPEEKKRYSHDVVFVGSFYQNRADIFEELTNFDLGIWGPGWQKLPENSKLKPLIRGGSLAPTEWTKLLGCAKIVIVTHYQDPQNIVPCYQASPKLFENLACGAFTIVDDQKDVRALFKHKEHLAFFKNVDELKKLILHYLKNSTERKEIAAKGQEYVLKKHTFEHRIDTLIQIISCQGAGDRVRKKEKN